MTFQKNLIILIFHFVCIPSFSQSLWESEIDVFIEFEKDTIMVSEPSFFYVVIENQSDNPILLYYIHNRCGRNTNFDIKIKTVTEKIIEEPLFLLSCGGLSFPIEIASKESKRLNFFLPNFGNITESGQYLINASKDLLIAYNQKLRNNRGREIRYEKIFKSTEKELFVIPYDSTRVYMQKER